LTHFHCLLCLDSVELVEVALLDDLSKYVVIIRLASGGVVKFSTEDKAAADSTLNEISQAVKAKEA
jgi:hypothetical protein